MPIGLQLPEAGLEHRIPPLTTAAALGASTLAGNPSATVLGVAWPAPWVISVVTATPVSAASLAAVSENAGEKANAAQPVTVNGALAV